MIIIIWIIITFTRLAFEKVCQQCFWQMGLSGKLPFVPISIGKWWHTNEEIDLIALGESEAVFVECKWTIKPVGVDILADLERKAELVRTELENCPISFALCSRSGFTSQLTEDIKQRQGVMLLNLPEIVG